MSVRGSLAGTRSSHILALPLRLRDPHQGWISLDHFMDCLQVWELSQLWKQVRDTIFIKLADLSLLSPTWDIVVIRIDTEICNKVIGCSSLLPSRTLCYIRYLHTFGWCTLSTFANLSHGSDNTYLILSVIRFWLSSPVLDYQLWTLLPLLYKAQFHIWVP